MLTRRLQSLAQRAFRGPRAGEPARILPFRGYGTSSRVFLGGRVLRGDGRPRWRGLRNRGLPHARVRASFEDRTIEFDADEEGYFRIPLELGAPLEPGWHEAQFELLDPVEDGEDRAKVDVLVPPGDAEFGVIGILHKNAHSRSHSPGALSFSRALKLGSTGVETNPIFYVSGSPWTVYAQFEMLFEEKDVPRGPLLLRDRRAEPSADKLARIRHLLGMYPSLQFVLIGDSAQRDPEIFRQLVEEHPGRIRAIYLRHGASRRREREVRAIAEAVREHDVPMLLAKQPAEAMAHARELGLISRRTPSADEQDQGRRTASSG